MFFLIFKVSFIFLNFVGFKTVFQLLCCSNFVTLTRQIVEPYGSSSAQANSEINFYLRPLHSRHFPFCVSLIVRNKLLRVQADGNIFELKFNNFLSLLLGVLY